MFQVTHIRGEAELQEDVDHSQRLLGAARQVADATTRMIEAARSCASSPDVVHQLALKTAAEDLKTATGVAARDHIRRRTIQRLEHAAKQTAAAAAQTIAAAKASESSNTNTQSQEQLSKQCVEVSESFLFSD
jgi:talin